MNYMASAVAELPGMLWYTWCNHCAAVLMHTGVRNKDPQLIRLAQAILDA